MAMLQHYTEELEETFKELQACVDGNSLKKMDSLLEDAKSMIASIELCRPSNANVIIPQYKQQYTNYKKKHEEMQYSSLKEGATTSQTTTQSQSQSQRQQLDQISKNNVERLEKSSAQLKEALRVAKETEEIGRGTMQMLEVQREQMIGMNDKLAKIDTSLGQASKELSAMEKRQRVMKVLTFGLA